MGERISINSKLLKELRSDDNGNVILETHDGTIVPIDTALHLKPIHKEGLKDVRVSSFRLRNVSSFFPTDIRRFQ